MGEQAVGRRAWRILLLSPSPVVWAAPTWAAWSHDSFMSDPVSVAPGHNRSRWSNALADGQEGTLHTWLAPGASGVGIQHLSTSGDPLRGGAAGIPVFNEDPGALFIAVCSDGAGVPSWPSRTAVRCAPTV